MRSRTAIIFAVVGIGAFVALELGKRNESVQTPNTPSQVGAAEYAEVQARVEAELTLPIDPAAKQRAIDAELNRAVKRAIEVEVNRAIERALSDAKGYGSNGH
jgi:hypothetical protein